MGRDVTDGTVQSTAIAVIDILSHHSAGFVNRQRHSRADALSLDGLMEAFQFAIGLRIKRRNPHVGHSGGADELLEILRDELRTIVGDDSWSRLGEPLPSPLEDDFHVTLQHVIPDLPVNDGAAVSIQNEAQVIERSVDVDTGNGYVPMLMCLFGLLETSAFP